MRRGMTLLLGTLTIVAMLAGSSIASTRATGRSVFYLALRSGDCAVWPHSGKVVRAVSCSNPAHNLETYWVGHGGWGHASRTHAAKFAAVKSRCLAAFQRRFGHPIRTPYGWYAFWPDSGAEQAKYGDRVECSLVRYPGAPAMGAGRHS